MDRLRRIGLAALAGLAAYFAIFGGEYGILELRALDRQAAGLEQRVWALRAEVDSLREAADQLEHDSATLERVARERYGLIRDGEILYRFVERPRLDTPGSNR